MRLSRVDFPCICVADQTDLARPSTTADLSPFAGVNLVSSPLSADLLGDSSVASSCFSGPRNRLPGLPFKVSPHSFQSGHRVFERVNSSICQTRLVRLSTGSKNVQDQLGSVDHLDLECPFQVACSPEPGRCQTGQRSHHSTRSSHRSTFPFPIQVAKSGRSRRWISLPTVSTRVSASPASSSSGSFEFCFRG